MRKRHPLTSWIPGSERDCSFSLPFHGLRMKRVSCSLTLGVDAERAQRCSIVGLSPLTLNMETKDRSVSGLSAGDRCPPHTIYGLAVTSPRGEVSRNRCTSPEESCAGIPHYYDIHQSPILLQTHIGQHGCKLFVAAHSNPISILILIYIHTYVHHTRRLQIGRFSVLTRSIQPHSQSKLRVLPASKN